jgi:hypothetical protein
VSPAGSPCRAAILTLMFPLLGAAILIGSAAAFYVFRIRK